VGPTTTFTQYNSDPNKWESKSSITVKYEAKDNEIGVIDHYEYTHDDVKTVAEPRTEQTTTGEKTFAEAAVDKDGKYAKYVFVRAVDSLGNKGAWTTVSAWLNMDTVAPKPPTINVTGDDYKKIVGLTFEDNVSPKSSGFGKYTYKLNGTDGTISVQNGTFDIINVSNNNVVQAWSWDKAGNQSTVAEKSGIVVKARPSTQACTEGEIRDSWGEEPIVKASTTCGSINLESYKRTHTYKICIKENGEIKWGQEYTHYITPTVTKTATSYKFTWTEVLNPSVKLTGVNDPTRTIVGQSRPCAECTEGEIRDSWGREPVVATTKACSAINAADYKRTHTYKICIKENGAVKWGQEYTHYITPTVAKPSATSYRFTWTETLNPSVKLPSPNQPTRTISGSTRTCAECVEGSIQDSWGTPKTYPPATACSSITPSGNTLSHTYRICIRDGAVVKWGSYYTHYITPSVSYSSNTYSLKWTEVLNPSVKLTGANDPTRTRTAGGQCQAY
jgi:hypothetical protein